VPDLHVVVGDRYNESASQAAGHLHILWPWAGGSLGGPDHGNLAELVVLSATWLHLAKSSWWDLSEELHEHSDLRRADNLSGLLFAYLIKEWGMHGKLQLALGH